VEVGGWLPRGEHHQHRLRAQPSRRERQRLRRGAVQPLRVVDHAHERPLGGHLRQQAEHGQADQEPIRRGPRFQAKRYAERGPLRPRQPAQTIEHRPAQLVQRGEGQLHLRLDPDRPGHLQVRCLPDRVVQQGRLPGARFAPDDQYRAVSVTRLVEQPAQDLAFVPSPEQPAGSARQSFGTCQARSSIHRGNRPSLNVARKLGFAFRKPILFAGEPRDLYRIRLNPPAAG
jgi:hypothetical protein